MRHNGSGLWQATFLSVAVAAASVSASWSGSAWAAESATVQQPHVTARLVSAADTVRPGEAIEVGVVLEMERHWHTYWRNPGDSGMATDVRWELAGGFEASEIDWPAPRVFEEPGGLTTFGYGDRVVLPVRIAVPEGVSDGSVTLRAKVTWLVCREVCLPGDAELSLELPVGEGSSGPDEASAALLAEAWAAVPAALPEDAVNASWVTEGERAELRLSAEAIGPIEPGTTLWYLPYEGAGFEHVRVTLDGGAAGRPVTLPVAVSPVARQRPERVRGVLLVETDGSRAAYEADVSLD